MLSTVPHKSTQCHTPQEFVQLFTSLCFLTYQRTTWDITWTVFIKHHIECWVALSKRMKHTALLLTLECLGVDSGSGVQCASPHWLCRLPSCLSAPLPSCRWILLGGRTEIVIHIYLALELLVKVGTQSPWKFHTKTYNRVVHAC